MYVEPLAAGTAAEAQIELQGCGMVCTKEESDIRTGTLWN